jgi:hypothetical protein
MPNDDVPIPPTPLPYAAPPPRPAATARVVLAAVAVALMLALGIGAWHLLHRTRYTTSATTIVRLQDGPGVPWNQYRALAGPVPPSLSTTERVERTRCADNLRRIAAALQSYANAHDWRYPDRLEDLVEAGLLPSDVLACPSEGQSSYVYTARGLTFPLDADTVLLHERSATSHQDEGDDPEAGLHVLRADGRSRFLPAREAGPLFAAGDRPGPLTLPTTRPHTDATASSGSPDAQHMDR